jgi:hypothetical protein
MRACLVLLVCLAGCNDRGLPSPVGDGGSDLGNADLAGADLARPDLAGTDLGNACLAAGGYCQPGDFVQPTCKAGTVESQSIEMANPGVCGLGICCVPSGADCRTNGCSPGQHCDGCLTPNGVDYFCLDDGSAC